MFICVRCLVPSDIHIQFSGCKQYVTEFAGQYSSLLAVLFVPISIQLSWPMYCLCLPTLIAAPAYQLSYDVMQVQSMLHIARVQLSPQDGDNRFLLKFIPICEFIQHHTPDG
jgi:hypothetical protein